MPFSTPVLLFIFLASLGSLPASASSRCLTPADFVRSRQSQDASYVLYLIAEEIDEQVRTIARRSSPSVQLSSEVEPRVLPSDDEFPDQISVQYRGTVSFADAGTEADATGTSTPLKIVSQYPPNPDQPDAAVFCKVTFSIRFPLVNLRTGDPIAEVTVKNRTLTYLSSTEE